MITKRLKVLLMISIVIVYLHFFEEVISGFYKNDWIMISISNLFQSVNQAQYYGSHVVWILMIGPAALLVLGGKWILRVLTLYGLFFVFELHHLIDAVRALNYYPGVITNIAFVVVGFFYWKELIRCWRRNYDNS